LLKESSEVETEVDKMKRYGEFYCQFVNPAISSSFAIRSHLQAFIEIDSTTCYPLLMRLFDSRQRSIIDDSQLEQCLSVLESFLVRRLVCGLPTNALNKVFPQLAKTYEENDVVAWLPNSLKMGAGTRRWPNDEELEEAILTQPQYGRKATKYVLSTIGKSFDHKEPIDWGIAVLTIEHVLPQTLNDEWKESLGPNFERIHQRTVDTLGNLTLTGYNHELGNMAFHEKKKLFEASHLEMNRWIAARSVWDEATIEERAETLINKAFALWPGPYQEAQSLEGSQVPEVSHSVDLTTGGWEKNSAIYDLYKHLSDQQWHPYEELVQVTAGRANVLDRLSRTRRRGKHRGAWTLEENNRNFRLWFAKGALG